MGSKPHTLANPGECVRGGGEGGCVRYQNRTAEPQRARSDPKGAPPRPAPSGPLPQNLGRAGVAAPRTRVGRGAPLRKARPRGRQGAPRAAAPPPITGG